jgi:hypothetical protein
MIFLAVMVSVIYQSDRVRNEEATTSPLTATCALKVTLVRRHGKIVDALPTTSMTEDELGGSVDQQGGTD